MCIYIYIYIQQLHIYYVCNLLCVEGSAVSRGERDAPSASHPGRAACRGAGTARPCQPGRAAAVPALGSPPPQSRGRAGRRCRRAGWSAGAEGSPRWRIRAARAALASSALSAGGCEEGFLAASPAASPGGSPKGSRPGSPLPTPQAPRVDLQGAELWKRFHEIGTEMIITKAGR